MAIIDHNTALPPANLFTANLACFGAMLMWAFAFPSAEILLQSWGVIALGAARQLLAVATLLLIWICLEGRAKLSAAPWWRGLGVGGLGFGLGAILFLVGQQLSDPVTPAIAASMMPIVGAALEIALDGRRLRAGLVIGILLAMAGGYLATGVKLDNAEFGAGALLCLVSVVLFAWATRSTTRNFPDLSPIGQTTITLAGGVAFMTILLAAASLYGFEAAEIGLLDGRNITLLLISSIASLAAAQFLWIWGAGGLGILLASMHMNAVPFYVMVIVVLLLGDEWNWLQAAGAALVAAGVMLAQLSNRVK